MGHDRSEIDLRQRIINAARQSFAARGFSETSVRQVAAAAKTTKPMIYYYFGSKAGLYQALIDEASGKVQRSVDSLIGSGDPPCQRLLELTRGHQSLRKNEPDAVLILAVAARSPLSITVRDEPQEPPLADSYRDLLLAILTAGKDNGSFRPVRDDLVTRLFTSAMDLFDVEPPPTAEEVLDLLLNGISTRMKVDETPVDH